MCLCVRVCLCLCVCVCVCAALIWLDGTAAGSCLFWPSALAVASNVSDTDRYVVDEHSFFVFHRKKKKTKSTKGLWPAEPRWHFSIKRRNESSEKGKRPRRWLDKSRPAFGKKQLAPKNTPVATKNYRGDTFSFSIPFLFSSRRWSRGGKNKRDEAYLLFRFWLALFCLRPSYLVLPRYLPRFIASDKASSSFYRVLLGSAGSYRVLPSFTGFYLVKPSFNGFYRVSIQFVFGFTELNQVLLLGFT